MENATKEEILKELFTHFNQDITDIYEKGENNKEIYNTFKYEEDTNIHKFEHNGLEYNIIESEDEAERIAIEQIKEDLEEDPGMFTQSWLQDFIYISDTDKRIMCNEEEEYIREQVREEELDEDESPEKEEGIDKIVELRLNEYKIALEDPIQYFVDEQGIYS